MVIFRLLQEAMNNIQKHSRADRMKISLSKGDSAIAFGIEDNGCGFSPEDVGTRKPMGQGFGLTGMKERVELSGGNFEITSIPGQGTSIRASWKTNLAGETA